MKLPLNDIQAAGQVQMDLTFDGGLHTQFPAYRDVLRAAVYGCGRPLKIIAADLDMTASELSRKLADNPNDPIHFPAHLLPELIRATGDMRPIYWLIEGFLDDADSRRKRAMDGVADLLPKLQALLAQAAPGAGQGRR